MQDRANGDSEEKSAGEISHRDEQQPEDERRAVQRRTFTRWMNVFLQRRDPPLEVHDLFTDIQDGRILMALLEELTGCKLLYRFRSSSHRIFRLNNISKALAFLDDRHVRLLGIDASGIADGVPSVVLNLLWNIILYFQVKEATRGLKQHLSSSVSSLSTSSCPSSGDLSPQPNDIGSYSCSTLPTKGRKAAREPKYHGKAIKTLLQWVQRCTSKFGVEVLDFGKSWRSGLAILAVIKSLNPALVDLRESLSREPRENLRLAFMIAHQSLDIPPLLEPEDVLCASPDEKSIITYVSMFLRHCSGTHEGCTTDIEVFMIPNFGSLDSVHFGETLADDPEAKALLRGFEKSSEQLLWKRWARRPSGSTSATSPHISGAVISDESITEKLTDTGPTSPFNKKRSRCRSVFKPPSPLDACVGSQEIRSWMEKASAEHGYCKPRVDESHFSLSSEEGIYSLTALDSDEEEAYSYILDLNKDCCQPYDQLKRQVPRVEEETAEEMFLNGQQTEESKHLEVRETLNFSGSKHKEGPLTQIVESEVGAQSVIQREFDENKSRSAEMTNNRAAFDMEPKEESRNTGRCEEERAVREQRADDGDYCEEERHGYDKTKALIEETRKTKPFEVVCWKTELEAANESDLLEKCGQASEKTELDEEEGENLTTSDEQPKRKLWREKEENAKKEVKENQNSVNLKSFTEGTKEPTLIVEAVNEVRGACTTGFNTTEEENHRRDTPPKMEDFKDFEPVVTIEKNDGEFNIKRHELSVKTATTKLKNETNGGVRVHGGDSSRVPACSATSPSFRERGFILQPLAASCDITPLELETLLVLWILLYCCFILL